MHAAIRRVLPSARQRLARPPRLGRPPLSPHHHLRLGAPLRCFSHSPALLHAPDAAAAPPVAPAAAPPGSTEDNIPSMAVEHKKKEEAAATVAPRQEDDKIESTFSEVPQESDVLGAAGGDAAGERPATRPGRLAGTKRRVSRKAVTMAMPKPVLPEWFLERGVVLKEEKVPVRLGLYSDTSVVAAKATATDATIIETATIEATTIETTPTEEVAKEAEAAVPAAEEPTKEDQPADEVKEEAVVAEVVKKEEATTAEEPVAKERYQLHESVWKEITTNIRTGLLLPKGAFADSLASTKSHYLLHLPKEGGLYFLDAATEKLAEEVGADLIRIDVQDFSEIAGDYLGDSQHVSRADITPVGIRSLAYDTQFTSSRNTNEEEDANNIESTEEFEEEEDGSEQPPPSVPSAFSVLSTLPTHLQNLIRSGVIAIPLVGGGNNSSSSGDPFASILKEQQLDRMNERKIGSLLEAMIGSAQLKRASRAGSPTTEPAKQNDNKTIIHIRDYREMEQTQAGDALLKMLHTIVQERRREGDRIIIVGTTSTEEELSRYTKAGVKNWQSCSNGQYERTIIVPPALGEEQNKILAHDRASRFREVNIRHLRDVIRRRSGENGESAMLTVPEGWHLNPGEDAESQIPEISTSSWSFDRVHRVVTVALGEQSNPDGEISIADIARAVQVIEKSDNIKFQWAVQESEYLKERDEAEAPVVPEESATTKKSRVIPKNLTTHEKKLVTGIIEPKDIHHGFSSVRAPPDTIDAMKTLTSLSLVRPEAFKYGVLATDRIPGVLLYGPPGTGKTLLARAVAKESGATVLEVSGSDIFNMYVGEGEKNVKAIFSLAKKLSPCVVFIDEADAIFGSRQSFSSRSSHREIINQFLKEWADMDSTAFIMVATNRPFDLDDAILRRLPRRILIDLPTAEDRHEILKIHLAAEILDPSVDLKSIADSSTMYSGSDLKNLCVSAALTCVKAENAEFERLGKYPEKRILTKAHFDKAVSEITASISDDMGSLGLIRKFDEKYGERGAGKKKAKSAWGFDVGQIAPGANKGEGRVRID